MRAPQDMPRPGGRGRAGRGGQGRGRAVLIAVAVLFVVGLLSLRAIAGFWTDYLWYDSLDQTGVFTGVLRAKLTLVVLFTGGFFALAWVNFFVAERLAPAFRGVGPVEELPARYREIVGARTGLVRTGTALLFALIAGAGTGSQWNEWLLFRNSVDFGEATDPQFHRDIGFYVFKLPFLSYVVGWLFAALVIVLILTAVFHYLHEGIRLQAPGPERVTPQVKVHLSVLLGLLALVKAAGYYLQQFELTVSTRGTVDGATYTDVHAQLPAIQLLIFVAIAAFVLFVINIRRKGWVLPVLGIGIWAIVAVIGGVIVPAAVQRFRVQPSELSREREYIADNIAATREAIGLAEVEDAPFIPDTDFTAEDLTAQAQAALDNVRLWDPAPNGPTGQTFESLQALRNFYAIADVDVDRYRIDGDLTQVVLSARELNTDGVPQSSWQATHLTFTHGYGLVMARTNEKTSQGEPDFLVSDIPLRSDVPELEIEQPGIYFGEGQDGYVITGTNVPETDFQNEEGVEQETTYEGADGVGIGSFFRRAAFALRFGDLNPLFSGDLRSDSRVHYIRDISDRARRLAPFLDFDGDPYPVVIDGHVQWILDAYTTTDRYPYAQRAVVDGLARTDLDHRFNYIRNSVKAVIDAYDGTVSFYIVDPTDPILQAYRHAFPDLFATEPPPEEIAEHFRYPEGMFRVQSNMWGRYHLDDPGAFFRQLDGWVVARDPERPRAPAVATGATTTTTNPDQAPSQRDRIAPYYVLTQLPDQDELGLQLIRPFVPFSPGDDRQQLTAYLIAQSDGPRAGELTSYRVTGGELPSGPELVADRINGNVEVSREQTLLCREGGGSRCTFGNLILVPLGDSLLYVQPLYVRSERENAPALLQRVIVEFDGGVAIATTLNDALAALDTFDAIQEGDTGEEPPEETPGEEVTPESIAELLTQADDLFQEADDALRAGDLGLYAEKIAEARAVIDEVQRLVDAGSDGTDGSTTTTTTTVPREETTSTTGSA